MKIAISILTFFFLLQFASAQKIQPSNNRTEYKKNYEWRIKQATLGGMYIPKDIPDVFKQLIARSDTASLNSFKKMPETEAVNYQMDRLGMLMLKSWDFYEGSRISNHLRELGVTNPEDMSFFLLLTFHRNLNNKPLDIKPIVEKIKKYRYDKKQKEIKAQVNKDSISK
jgi:hypothetical protein